ncbi:hypothetical protein SYJ56_16490 [Algoriphagus sp. D3-2-R+10]|uniref:hypothetical protein n=1 Tax=Algoriphagus aurantiacus TaxID=3103948 RepID=UPI002B3E3B80|nr:hypothetical protein [Algoriphagus sp. D3-2-R+10]MEB2776916.1 hypothetical protein [Algoriphagus sp. D3-2-R+10]
MVACLNKGEVIYDATACPQDIAYPTDIGLLNRSREITESIIDELHAKSPQGKKPRTYRKVARKRYLKVAQNKNPSRKTIRKGIKSQLQYLRRNFRTIEKQLDGFAVFPLAHRLQHKYWIIQTVYDQQLKMFKARKPSGGRSDSQDRSAPHPSYCPRESQGKDRVRGQDPPESGGRVFVSEHHLLGCLQRGEPPARLRRKLQKALRLLS